MKRRHFIEFSTSLLASIGLSQLELTRQANRYGKVLAQSTGRKLALLVGINDYKPEIGPLEGCLTDVEMERELLVNRFGFNPSDILEVTNQQATRQGILTAFDEHIIKQAKPGDVVVFHYSGHGDQVIDPNPIGNNPNNSTMVPIDRQAGLGSGDANFVPDIMGHTLFLLMSLVPTENISVVLDSCHSGGGKRGNLVVRAAKRGSDVTLQASPAEFEYQEQLISRLNISKTQVLELRKKGIAKGVVMAAAKAEQFAADAPFEGFRAGAFSYLLTRYLWQETGNKSLENTFVNLARRTKDLANSSGVYQDPEYEVKPGSDYEKKPIYFLEKTRPSAEAVIRKFNPADNQVEFWLGGVASQSLKGFEAGAIFTVINDREEDIGQIQQDSRVGLVGYGKPIGNTKPEILKPGTLLREQVRGIPSDLSLRVGVDDTLGGDQAKVRAALQGQKRIEPVSVDQKSVADYIVGRVTQADFQSWQKQGISNLPPVGALGLFTSGRIPIDASFGQVGESTDNALQRLRPKLKLLLAGRMLQTLVNGDTSRVNVTTSMRSVTGRSISGSTSSRGVGGTPAPITSQKLQFPPGAEVQVQVQNNDRRNLYVSVLVIGSTGEIVILFPLDWDAAEDAAYVAPKETITVPQPDDNFQFILSDQPGSFEVLILASAAPLKNALKGLREIARSQGITKGVPLSVPEDTDVMGDLLGDVDTNSRSTGGSTINLVPRDRQAVGTGQLATMSMVVEIVQ